MKFTKKTLIADGWLLNSSVTRDDPTCSGAWLSFSFVEDPGHHQAQRLDVGGNPLRLWSFQWAGFGCRKGNNLIIQARW